MWLPGISHGNRIHLYRLGDGPLDDRRHYRAAGFIYRRVGPGSPSQIWAWETQRPPASFLTSLSAHAPAARKKERPFKAAWQTEV